MVGAHQRVVSATELAAMRALAEAAAPPAVTLPFVSELQRATRSWGRSLLLLGVLHFVLGGFLSAPWGVLLVLVGVASFYFQSSAVFVLYGVTLAWAAVHNGLSGQIGWILFGLLQVYWTVRVFRQFRRFRQAEQETWEALGGEGVTDRAARLFPWAGGLLGGLSLLLYVGTVILLFLLAALSEGPSSWDTYGFIMALALNGAVLGFALGLASVLCRYSYRAVGVLGMVAGALTVLVQVGIQLLPGG